MKKRLIMPKIAFLLLNLIPQVISAENSVFFVDFDEAMVSDENDREKYIDFRLNTPHQQLFKAVEQQYKDFQTTIVTSKKEELTIPKIIHQIWIGPLPFPQEAREWQESWSKLHPDWEYKLWTNKEVESFEFENKKYYDEATNWGEKSDILRYEILYLYGGLYVDVDFECRSAASLDELHHVCDFYTGIHMVRLLLKNRLRINNGLIAARPQHPIIAHARDQIKNFRHESGVATRTGPDFFTSVIDDVLPSSLAAGSIDIVFPSNFFYPSGPKGGGGYKIKRGLAYVQPETIAVHYYTSYWIIKPKEPKKPRGPKKQFESKQTQVVEQVVTGKESKPRKVVDPKRLEKRYQDYLDKKKAGKLGKTNAGGLKNS